MPSPLQVALSQGQGQNSGIESLRKALSGALQWPMPADKDPGLLIRMLQQALAPSQEDAQVGMMPGGTVSTELKALRNAALAKKLGFGIGDKKAIRAALNTVSYDPPVAKQIRPLLSNSRMRFPDSMYEIAERFKTNSSVGSDDLLRFESGIDYLDEPFGEMLDDFIMQTSIPPSRKKIIEALLGGTRTKTREIINPVIGRSRPDDFLGSGDRYIKLK